MIAALLMPCQHALEWATRSRRKTRRVWCMNEWFKVSRMQGIAASHISDTEAIRMQVPTVALGGLRVSRFLVGGNPFAASLISHEREA